MKPPLREFDHLHLEVLTVDDSVLVLIHGLERLKNDLSTALAHLALHGKQKFVVAAGATVQGGASLVF